jgi:hypothetical protein
MGKYNLDFKAMFVYDETSPTSIRWIIPRKGVGGKPVARRNEGVAGNLTASGVSVNISGILYSVKFIVWILNNGDIPEGKDILFIDGNSKNVKVGNLYLSKDIDTTIKYSDYLKDYFYYDETSPSCLRWKAIYSKGSTVRIGSVAGSLDTQDGYWRIHALGTFLKVHKVVWAITKETSQVGLTIDHVNGVRSDNRIENLRLVDNYINQRNRSKNSNNSTGHTGISFSSREQPSGMYSKFTASYYGGKKHTSKTFSIQKYGEDVALKMAIAWRTKMIEELNLQGAGYTDRHGK